MLVVMIEKYSSVSVLPICDLVVELSEELRDAGLQ